jgi:glucuronoarabinoxylan endo-1,4-beta-xylanase
MKLTDIPLGFRNSLVLFDGSNLAGYLFAAAMRNATCRVIAIFLGLALAAPALRAQETLTVNLNSPRQTIHGFGAGMKRQTTGLRNMNESKRTEVLKLMFTDVDTRILRTYLRHNHEPANDNTKANVLNPAALNFDAYADDVWLLQQAVALGGPKLDTFYASCNTGPVWMKDNGNIIGGTLLTTHHTEFAEFIWAYLRWMKLTHGIDISALSIFNEPDYNATHDSMNPGAAQAANIMAAVGSYLTTAIAAEPLVTRPLLLGPDCFNPGGTINYLNTMLNNPACAAALDVVAGHYYGGTAANWTSLNTLAGNRMMWMTEWAALSDASDDIADGMLLATKMHDVMAGGAEAYVAFQWIDETTDTSRGNGLIRIQNNSYVVPKRYHVFKQFANSTPRGSRRVAMTSTTSGLLVSAYLWPDGNTYSIQVINPTGNAFNNVIFNCGTLSGTVTRQRTSSTLNAANLPVSLTAANNSFSDSIFSNTFTTYIGTKNVLPTISGVGNRTVNEGTSTGAIAFTVGDLETSAAALTVSGTSSNTVLVPNANIVFGGGGANRTVTVTPAANKLGSATITLTVNDGTLTASRTFVLTVTGDAMATWRFANFNTTANTGNAADTADWDSDGWTNAQEYVFGTSPTSPNNGPILSPSTAGGNFTFSFTANQASGPGYSGLRRYFDVETTNDPANAMSWSGVPGYTNIVGVNQSVTLIQPLTGGPRFYRLNVNIKP